MKQPTRILIVEDEVIIAANLSMKIAKAGYEVIGMLHRGEAVMTLVQQELPDIVLLDINLGGELDGIEVGQLLRLETNCALVYLTANSDDDTFSRAKSNFPEAFLTKPFDEQRLLRTLDLIATRRANVAPVAPPYKLTDRLFVRHRERLTRLLLKEVLFIKADRNYCHLQATNDAYVLTKPLKSVATRLPGNFIQVHRSFVVNLKRVTEVMEQEIAIGNHRVPLSRSYRDDFLARIDTV